jgi:hypothetical protein
MIYKGPTSTNLAGTRCLKGANGKKGNESLLEIFFAATEEQSGSGFVKS